MYDYGRDPLSPHLRRAFPTLEAVRDHLFHEDEPVRRLLATSWRRRRLSGEDPGWAMWTRPPEDPREAPPTHKLYLSPRFDGIRPTVHAAMPVITASDAIGFKIGAELPYLVRPDKLVVYFTSREETLRTGRELALLLAGLPPMACRSPARSNNPACSPGEWTRRATAPSSGAGGRGWPRTWPGR